MRSSDREHKFDESRPSRSTSKTLISPVNSGQKPKPRFTLASGNYFFFSPPLALGGKRLAGGPDLAGFVLLSPSTFRGTVSPAGLDPSWSEDLSWPEDPSGPEASGRLSRPPRCTTGDRISLFCPDSKSRI